MNKPNEPAYPGIQADLDHYEGMSTRLDIAKHIMAGLVQRTTLMSAEHNASVALDHADALLKLESETRA